MLVFSCDRTRKRRVLSKFRILEQKERSDLASVRNELTIVGNTKQFEGGSATRLRCPEDVALAPQLEIDFSEHKPVARCSDGLNAFSRACSYSSFTHE